MFKIKEDGNNKIRRRKSDMKVMKAQTLGAVHTHTHTQALLSVEEKKQKSKINKFNRNGKRSIILLCFLLPSFCVEGLRDN